MRSARFDSCLALVAMILCGASAVAQNDSPCQRFRRGDANADYGFDIADGVFTLAYLFGGGPAPGCLDAADSNDTGVIDISDPIYTLTALFRDGPLPPAPGPYTCGIDPTPDDLDCRVHRPCPATGDCLCRENGACPPGHYCAKAEGDCDGEGVCRERPSVCLDIWDPVCGCDGRTYANECVAAAAGINVAHEGQCRPPQ